MSAALEMRGVVKQYGKRAALDRLNLTVPAGCAFGLVGSNGAGKTTAIGSIVGFIEIQAGSIDLLGLGAYHPRTHAGRVSVLPQDAQLPPYARVRELLLYYGSLQGLSGEPLQRETDTWLRHVHLEDRANDKVRSLSHGMRRRLTVAQAMLGDPQFVLLDEPLNGLDPAEVANLRTLLKHRKPGQTLLISSHLLTEIEAVCDHVAFIEVGRRVRQDTLSRIRQESSTILYRIAGDSVPLERLRSELSGIEFTHAFDGTTLTAAFDESSHTPEQVNAAVLAILLDAQVGIFEVRRGTDLETEYLKTRSSQ